MNAQNGLLSADTLAAIRWLGMPEGTPFPLAPIPEATADIPEDDLAAWRDAFEDWRVAECVIRPRCFGGIGCLHVHCADWINKHSTVCAPTRRTFERLLVDSGFLMADGMVSELILKEDWDACHQLVTRAWSPQLDGGVTRTLCISSVV